MSPRAYLWAVVRAGVRRGAAPRRAADLHGASRRAAVPDGVDSRRGACRRGADWRGAAGPGGDRPSAGAAVLREGAAEDPRARAEGPRRAGPHRRAPVRRGPGGPCAGRRATGPSAGAVVQDAADLQALTHSVGSEIRGQFLLL
jgi:hypothetical protein